MATESGRNVMFLFIFERGADLAVGLGSIFVTRKTVLDEILYSEITR